jgi:hypothetical protein
MSIKSDKTFEEIVERLVALFKPEHDDADTKPHSGVSSSDVSESQPPTVVPSSPAEDDTQN